MVDVDRIGWDSGINFLVLQQALLATAIAKTILTSWLDFLQTKCRKYLSLAEYLLWESGNILR